MAIWGRHKQTRARSHNTKEENDFLRGMALPEVTHLERGMQIQGLPMARPLPMSGHHDDKACDMLSILE